MKKTLVTLLLLTGSAGAVAVDCSTPSLYASLLLTYSTKPGFPNKPEEKSVRLPELTAPLKICDLTFSFSKATQAITIEAGARASLEYLTNEPRQENIIELSLFEAQRIGPVAEALIVGFELYGINGTNSVRAVVRPGQVNDTVVGIRFDGGQLQPLLYNGAAKAVSFPSTTKTVDVYVKSAFGPSWQRVNLNFEKPKMTVYLKSAFPSK